MIIIEIVRLKRYDHRVKRAQSPSEEQRSQALLTPKEDISSLLEKAKAGDAESQTELGERYLQGEGGVPQNGELGIQWVNAAVAQGYIPAYATLGVAYSRGKGVAQDYEKAVECFRTAAAANDAYGQQWLGSAYLLGQGVEEDHDKAFHYLRLAAAQGNQDAIDTLKEADRAFNPPSAPTQSPTQPAQVPQDDPKTGGACPGLWLAIAGTIVGFFCLYCAYSRRICWNMPMGAKICPVKISG
jgi:tetratricopeptide (TPR) repeat protein